MYNLLPKPAFCLLAKQTVFDSNPTTQELKQDTYFENQKNSSEKKSLTAKNLE